MHALTILHRCIGPLLAGVHRAWMNMLFEAVAATVSGPGLTLTDIARRFAGGTALRHCVKRADRLLGNRHLQSDARGIYGGVARMLLAGVAEPLIVIDWSDPKADRSLHLASAPRCRSAAAVSPCTKRSTRSATSAIGGCSTGSCSAWRR